jgi:hypothetical protein
MLIFSGFFVLTPYGVFWRNNITRKINHLFDNIILVH